MINIFKSDELDTRRRFTYDERLQVLERTKGICACCGKKLTTKTMTVEHVIPLSRGGKNELKNLIALCPECNTIKGNLLYIPKGFYTALIGKPILEELETHVRDWFQTVSNEFNLTMFPMIAPCFNYLYQPVRTKKPVFSTQFLLQWQIIGTEKYDEINAVTDIDVKEFREIAARIGKVPKNHPVALYSYRKVNTDKILAIASVVYDDQNKKVYICMPWHCINKPNNLGDAMYTITQSIIYSLTGIADQEIDECYLITYDTNAFLRFIKGDINPMIGRKYEFLSNNQGLHMLKITRK